MQELGTGFLLTTNDIADEARRNTELPGKFGLIEACVCDGLSDPSGESI